MSSNFLIFMPSKQTNSVFASCIFFALLPSLVALLPCCLLGMVAQGHGWSLHHLLYCHIEISIGNKSIPHLSVAPFMSHWPHGNCSRSILRELIKGSLNTSRIKAFQSSAWWWSRSTQDNCQMNGPLSPGVCHQISSENCVVVLQRSGVSSATVGQCA